MPIDAPIPATPPIPNLSPSAVSQAVIAPPSPKDKWEALKQVGWWKTSDSVMLSILLAHIVTGAFFLVFGRMTFAVAVIGLLQCCMLLLVWCVMLAYRGMEFVLQLRAGIEMLPFDSARIAVGFLQGGQPLNTPVNR